MAYTTIDDPTLFFDTTTWSTVDTSIDTLNFQPDWVWLKSRSNADTQVVFDSARGANKRLSPSGVAAESTTSDELTAFNSDGFTLGTGDNVNRSSQTMVAWSWKAGTTSSISGGSITPAAVSINATSGFGIYRYTGTGSNGTIAHGLGTAPKFIVTKNRDSGSYGWYAYHIGIGATKNLYLHNSDATVTSSDRWNDTAPTSTLFTLSTNTGVNGSSANMIAYAFSEVKGYSKFGSYVGNNNADGAFIYTGFRPAWVMIKNTQTARDWFIWDNERSDGNPNLLNKYLRANTDEVEGSNSTTGMDFLSNGFKCRNDFGAVNHAETYVYLAFAKAPFVTAGTKAAGTGV